MACHESCWLGLLVESLFVPLTFMGKLNNYHLSYSFQSQDTFDIADPSYTQGTCTSELSNGLAHHRVPCNSVVGVQRPESDSEEGRETLNQVPRSWQDELYYPSNIRLLSFQLIIFSFPHRIAKTKSWPATFGSDRYFWLYSYSYFHCFLFCNISHNWVEKYQNKE